MTRPYAPHSSTACSIASGPLWAAVPALLLRSHLKMCEQEPTVFHISPRKKLLAIKSSEVCSQTQLRQTSNPSRSWSGSILQR